MNDIRSFNQLGGIPPDVIDMIETSNPLRDRADEVTDGPELSAPVWLKSSNYVSAVERSAKVDANGLCSMWGFWRKSDSLSLYLHGFLMVTSLSSKDAAWNEILFLYNLLECEMKA